MKKLIFLVICKLCAMQQDEIPTSKIKSLKELAGMSVLSLFTSPDDATVDEQLSLAYKKLPTEVIEFLQKKMDKNFSFTYLITFYAITSIDRLQKTLQFTKFDINKKNGGGYTLLHKAVTENYPEMVHYLLQQGADIHEQTNVGDTPLHIACVTGNTRVIQLLLNNTTVHAMRSLDRSTPLHVLAGQNPKNKELQKQLIRNVKLLLRAGANPRQSNLFGVTPVGSAPWMKIRMIMMLNNSKNKKG